MENKLENLKEKMDETVLKDVFFNEKLEQRILSSVKTPKFQKQSSPFKNRFNGLLSVTVTSMLFLGIIYFAGKQINLFNGTHGSHTNKQKEQLIETPNSGTVNTQPKKEDHLKTIIPFELTSNEKKAYGNFQNDLSLSHLERLDPISVAKLFVKAGFDKRYDVQYALYTDREGYVLWSKEEDEKIPSSDRGTNEQKLNQFKNIDKGEFIQTSDFEGYIEYDSSGNSEVKSGFKMIKNDNGVWQVAFMPIQ